MIGGLKKSSRYLLAGASAIGILAYDIPAAKAQDLKAIQNQIDSLQATVKALQKQVQDAKAQAAAATSAAADTKKDDLDLQVKWKGAPELSSKDGKFKFKVRGRVEADYNNIDQDTAITSFPDVSATELRRARLGVEGIAFYDVKYVLEVDFGGAAAGSFVTGTTSTGTVTNDLTSGVSVKDAYVQYQGWKIGEQPVQFRVGNFKTPNSFEEATTETYVDTMERAAFITGWGLDRQIGFMTAYWADHFGGAVGIYGEGPVGNSLFPGFTGDEFGTFAARGKIDPINRDVNGVTQVLHVGASVRTRDGGDDQPFLRYAAKGADFNLANAVIQTGNIGNSDTFWGLEAAGLWGPFSLQGEYAHLDVDLPNGTFIRNNSTTGMPTALNPFTGVPNPSYSGWYIEGSWFFGGHKTYNIEGRWDRPKIDNPMRWGEHSGWGALQLVGKYDVLDMSDTGNQNVNFQNVSPTATTAPRFVGACATTQLWPGQNAFNTTTGTPPVNVGGTNNVTAPRVAECGEMKTWVIGVNWYLNDYVRLMFNYAQSDLSGYPRSPAQSTGGGTTGNPAANFPANNGFDGATIRGFGMRAQVDF